MRKAKSTPVLLIITLGIGFMFFQQNIFRHKEGRVFLFQQKNEVTETALPFGREITDVLSVARGMAVKPLLVTLINKAYLPFALSWLCNTKDMGIHHQVNF